MLHYELTNEYNKNMIDAIDNIAIPFQFELIRIEEIHLAYIVI